MITRGRTSFPDLPTMGYLAIYSINLIILRTLLSPNGYTFNEEVINLYEVGASNWSRLIYLWRSWFSVETLNGLSAILIATRNGSEIDLRPKINFSSPSSNNTLEVVWNTSFAIADDFTAALSGLFLHDSFNSDSDILENINRILKLEDNGLEIYLATKQLRQILSTRERSYKAQAFLLAKQDILKTSSFQVNYDAVSTFVTEYVKVAMMIGGIVLADDLFHKLVSTEVADIIPVELGLELIELARQFDGGRYIEYFLQRIAAYDLNSMRKLSISVFFDLTRAIHRYGDIETTYDFYRLHIKDILREISINKLPVYLAIEIIKMAREFDDRSVLESFYRNYLNKIRLRRVKLTVEVAIELLRLAHIFKDKSFLKYLYASYTRSIIDQRRESDLFFDFIREVIILEREAGHWDLLEYLHREYLRNLKWEIKSLPSDIVYEINELTREIKKINNADMNPKSEDIADNTDELKRIYIGNLPSSISEDKIKDMFDKYGIVYKIDLIRDRETNKVRGFGFINMERLGAMKAIDELNGMELDGYILRVSEANKGRIDR